MGFILPNISIGNNPPKSLNRMVFEYDNAGNRTKRYIEINKIKGSDSIPESILEQFDDIAYDDLAFSSVSIFPNPVYTDLNIELAALPEDLVSFKIYDENGKLLNSNSFRSVNHSVSLKDFVSGIYFLFLTHNNETITFKIVKK